MGTIQDKLIYLDETKDLLRTAVGKYGVHIEDDYSFRRYVSSIDFTREFVMNKLDNLIGYGVPKITIRPGAVLPEDTPDQVHEDEEMIWPEIDWQVGSDDDFTIPTFIDPPPTYYNWYIGKDIFNDYTKIRYDHNPILYTDENIVSFSIEELKKILNGTEINIINTKPAIPIQEEVTFGYDFYDKSAQIADSVGTDGDFTIDRETVETAKIVDLVMSELRFQATKIETLPVPFKYEIENELTGQQIISAIDALFKGESSYIITDREYDPLIVKPIDEEVPNPTDTIWGTVGWRVGSDDDFEMIDSADNKTITFDDSSAKALEILNNNKSSYIQKNFVRHDDHSYYENMLSDIINYSSIPEINYSENYVEQIITMPDVEKNYTQEFVSVIHDLNGVYSY